MCTVCGCSEGETRIEGAGQHQAHHGHGHHHDHGHVVKGKGLHDYGKGPARAHAPGLSQQRMIQIETDILAKNDSYADANRRWFGEHGVLALNLVSSPGSGKTSLLTRTIEGLKDTLSMAVIEGDQETANDAERIRATDQCRILRCRCRRASASTYGLPCARATDVSRCHAFVITD